MSIKEKRKGIFIRLSILMLDISFVILLTILLSRFTGKFFARRSVLMLKIGSPNSLWKGPIPMIISAAGYFFFGLPFSGFIIFLPEAFFGASPGKMIFGIRVRKIDGQKASLKLLILRYALKTIGAWGLMVSLIVANMYLAAFSFVAGCLVLVGSLLAIGPSKLTLHDRLVGTAVYSK